MSASSLVDDKKKFGILVTVADELIVDLKKKRRFQGKIKDIGF
jgi:hypothetical protein